MVLTNYRSGTGDVLYLTQTYIYKLEIIKISKCKSELIATQNFSLDKYKEIKSVNPVYLENGDILLKEVYLIGAPEEFLVKNNYIKE